MSVLRKNFFLVFIAVIGLVTGIVATTTLGFLPIGHAVDSPGKSAAAAPFPQSGQIFAEASKKVTPAVVNISTTRQAAAEDEGAANPFSNDPFFKRFFRDEPSRRPRGPQGKERGMGSGVIVDPSGYIITNHHVIDHAGEIKVVLDDRREFKGKLIGSDPKSDLALIKVDAKELPTIPWGDSTRLQTGEYVLAVGNPFGLNQTVTMGIVSAVGRANVGIADYEDFIQTDAAINPGNSGGALVNVNGELIGINTAIFSQSGGYMGIGFAVPSDMAKTVTDSLIKTGKVSRGWLGVSIQEVTPDLAKEFALSEPKGALVSDVLPGSPAEQAGVKRGDIILELNGKEIKTAGRLRNLVASTSIGEKVKIKVFRENHEKELEATLGEQAKEMAQNDQGEEKNGGGTPLAGVKVTNLNPEMAKEMTLPNQKGVVVEQVRRDSRAGEAGLRQGDVILEVNRTAVKDMNEYNQMVSKLKKEEGALLLINRQGRTIFMSISAV